MNQTAPLQKQDLDRINALLAAILTELMAIRAQMPRLEPPQVMAEGRRDRVRSI